MHFLKKTFPVVLNTTYLIVYRFYHLSSGGKTDWREESFHTEPSFRQFTFIYVSSP